MNVDMRKAGKTSETSMAAAIMDKKGTLTVAEDGTMKLTLTFPKDALIAGLSSHATGIDVYDQDGVTKMEVEYTTYETTLYEGISANAPSHTGNAVSEAVITLSYEAEDGIYKAYIYADRMQNDIALYVDFSTVARDGDEDHDPVPPVEDKADKSKLADVIAKAEALKEADYTADSWKPVAEALAAAKAVNADEKATQAQVDEAMNTLTNAMSALVKADDKKDDGEQKDYTPGTYDAPITMYVDAMNQSFLIDGHVVIAEDGTAKLLIDFSRISNDGGKTWVSAYESGTVYYLAFNGYSKDGTSNNLTTDGAEITWVDVTGADGTSYHCLDKVTFPLPYLTTNSDGVAEYLVSLRFFVPGMSHLEFASEGFDYTVKMTVDLSEIPVKKDVDPGKDDNKNNGTDDGKDDGKNDDKKDDNKGGLVINGGSTTTKKDNTTTKTGTTTSGVKVANGSVKTGDTLNTLPWEMAIMMAALAAGILAVTGRRTKKEEN